MQGGDTERTDRPRQRESTERKHELGKREQEYIALGWNTVDMEAEMERERE